MKTVRSSWRALGLPARPLAALLVAALLVACGSDDCVPSPDAGPTDDTAVAADAPPPADAAPDVPTAALVDELVALGKARLSAGESLAAMDALDQALRLAPDREDATWGLVLARFQSSVSMFGSLVFLLNLKEDPDAPDLATRQAVTLRHEGTIGVTVDGLLHAATAQQARLATLAAAPGDPAFTLEGGLPLALGDHPMMTLCCDFDRSELLAISSFNNLLFAFASFLGSQDSDVSFDRIEDLFKGLPSISTAVTALLAEDPTILTLLPDGGAESWRAAADHLATAAEDALAAAALMAEGNDLARNVATLSDTEPRRLVLHGTFPSGATELALLWDGTTASLEDTVAKTARHLRGDATARLSLDGDALVAVGVLLDVVNRTVGVQTVLDAMGIELPAVVGTLFAALDPDDPEQVVGLLRSLLPMLGLRAGAVELDLRTFLDQPFHLRDLFPFRGPVPGSEYARFVKSFECPRVGVQLVAGDATTLATLLVHDPSATEDALTLTVTAHAAPAVEGDPLGDALDTETLTLAPEAGFTGVYAGTLPVWPGTPADGDGALVVPDGGSLQAIYTSAAHPDSIATLVGPLDALPAWDYGAACADDTTPFDTAHFGETEFAAALEIPAPGESAPLAAIPADGKARRAGVMAFPSPSFDGLLWLDGGDGLAVADQASFAAFLTGILSALEAF